MCNVQRHQPNLALKVELERSAAVFSSFWLNAHPEGVKAGHAGYVCLLCHDCGLTVRMCVLFERE